MILRQTGIAMIWAILAATAGCTRKAPPPEPMGTDIVPGMEMFSFWIGMSPAELHEAVYRIDNFRRPDGERPWFGYSDAMGFHAKCWRIENGKPRDIEGSFVDHRATRLTITYCTVTPQDRVELFSRLHSNAVAGIARVKDCTSAENGSLYFLEGSNFYGWMANPIREHEPIRISFSEFHRK